MSEKFKLEAPIKWGEKELTEIDLRSPTIAEIRRIGALPYDPSSDNADPKLDVTAKYISTCAGIPPSIVDKLSLGDFQLLSFKVVGFFTEPILKRFTTEPLK